jgi:hypothetical protein
VSSDAFLSFDAGEEVTLEDWQHFVSLQGLLHRPEVVGGNTYQHPYHPVQVRFGRGSSTRRELPAEAAMITFSTYFMGEACPVVAMLAVAAWQEFGGGLDAAPEIRNLIQVVPQ